MKKKSSPARRRKTRDALTILHRDVETDPALARLVEA